MRIHNVFSAHAAIFILPKQGHSAFHIARMRVPKLVKNGFNSSLHVSPVLEEDKIPTEIKNTHEAQSRPYIMKGEQKPS